VPGDECAGRRCPGRRSARPAAAPGLDRRILVGLCGVLLAVLVSGFNENITKVALADIRGAMGFSVDDGSWIVALYSAMSVSAMAFAPWCAATFSLRRFALAMIGGFMVLGVLCPLAPNLQVFLLLRALQGLCGGALPPLLMSVALRFLPPGIKLYGLAGYALTATFGPSMGTPLAAFWVEQVGWHWAFWQIVPYCLAAMAMVGWGLPQDPLRLERFAQFDGVGLLLGLPALVLLVLGLAGPAAELVRLADDHADDRWRCRPDGAVHDQRMVPPLPFFKLHAGQPQSQLLAGDAGRRAVRAAGGDLDPVRLPGQRAGLPAAADRTDAAVGGAAAGDRAAAGGGAAEHPRGGLPLGAGHRPGDAGAGLLAGLAPGRGLDPRQLPVGAAAAGVRPADGGAAAADAGHRRQAPQDGPFASAWFNTVKGFAAVLAGGVLDAVAQGRRHFHSTVLVDRLGGNRGWPMARSWARACMHRCRR
jgi:DHA2 family multidrug resistance protein